MRAATRTVSRRGCCRGTWSSSGRTTTQPGDWLGTILSCHCLAGDNTELLIAIGCLVTILSCYWLTGYYWAAIGWMMTILSCYWPGVWTTASALASSSRVCSTGWSASVGTTCRGTRARQGATSAWSQLNLPQHNIWIRR